MWEGFIPPEISVAAFWALLGSSFGASFVTAAFGLGGGVLLLAVCAVLLPPAALIPVHGAVQLGSNLGRAATLLRHVIWTGMPGFVAGAVIGVAIGGTVSVNIPPNLVQVLVGLFIVWSVLGRMPAFLRRWAVVTGLISSFLTMFFGATGPFVAAYTKSVARDRHGFVATHAAMMTTQHALKTLTFGLLGFAFAGWLWLTGAMIVAGFLGTLAGRSLLNRMTDARFLWILNAILLATAARLIWTGATGG